MASLNKDSRFTNRVCNPICLSLYNSTSILLLKICEMISAGLFKARFITFGLLRYNATIILSLLFIIMV